ncbi:MAG: hypothetical protein HKN44_04510 [Ilumatobacter sp.]|nr:hypothetical protein [Ilumatobacter sp.]
MSIATPHLSSPAGLLRRTARRPRPSSSRRIHASRVVPAGRFRRRNERHDSECNISATDMAMRQVAGIHSLHR